MTHQPPKVRIYDNDNQSRDWTWLRQRYGNVDLQPAQPLPDHQVFRLTIIREDLDEPTLRVDVHDPDGIPMPRVPVIRYCLDAPALPPWDPPPERYHNQGSVMRTNRAGFALHTLAPEDFYDPTTETGINSISLGVPHIHSDLVSGLGIPRTPDQGPDTASLHLTFQLYGAAPPEPPPEPPPVDPYKDAALALHTIGLAIQRLADVVAALDPDK